MFILQTVIKKEKCIACEKHWMRANKMSIKRYSVSSDVLIWWNISNLIKIYVLFNVEQHSLKWSTKSIVTEIYVHRSKSKWWQKHNMKEQCAHFAHFSIRIHRFQTNTFRRNISFYVVHFEIHSTHSTSSIWLNSACAFAIWYLALLKEEKMTKNRVNGTAGGRFPYCIALIAIQRSLVQSVPRVYVCARFVCFERENIVYFLNPFVCYVLCRRMLYPQAILWYMH